MATTPTHAHFLYMWVSADGQAVYIGQTAFPRERRGQHRACALKGSRTEFHTYLRDHGVNSGEWHHHPVHVGDAARLEQEWIDAAVGTGAQVLTKAPKVDKVGAVLTKAPKVDKVGAVLTKAPKVGKVHTSAPAEVDWRAEVMRAREETAYLSHLIPGARYGQAPDLM
jgi:predicted GIY-YIG superfamily endonuclease